MEVVRAKVPAPAGCLLVHGPFLFTGHYDGTIIRWDDIYRPTVFPQKHAVCITAICVWDNCLCTGSKKIKIWNENLDCINSFMEDASPNAMVGWKDRLITCSVNGVNVWTKQGDRVSWMSFLSTEICKLLTWNDMLITALGKKVTAWKEVDEEAFSMEHFEDVDSIAVSENQLYSLVPNKKEGKSHVYIWNALGQAVSRLTLEGPMRGLVVYQKYLYFYNLGDGVIVKADMNGISLDRYGTVQNVIIIWRGACVSGGNLMVISKWTNDELWTPSTHKLFPLGAQGAIKTFLMLMRTGKWAFNFPLDLIPVICRYIAVVTKPPTETQQ